MVTKFGMSDLGPVSLEGQEQPVFLGGDSMKRSEYSEAIASRIDAQVRSILTQSYEKAKNIIRQNRSTIDRIVDILIEQETINGEEFRQLVAQFSPSDSPKLVTSS
jgi:cell division protease FtsH